MQSEFTVMTMDVVVVRVRIFVDERCSVAASYAPL